MSVASTAPRGSPIGSARGDRQGEDPPCGPRPRGGRDAAGGSSPIRHPQGRAQQPSKRIGEAIRGGAARRPRGRGRGRPPPGGRAHRRDRRGARRAEAELRTSSCASRTPPSRGPRRRRGSQRHRPHVGEPASHEGGAADGSAGTSAALEIGEALDIIDNPRRQDRRLRLPGLQAQGPGCSARSSLVPRRATEEPASPSVAAGRRHTASARGTARSRTRRPDVRRHP